MTVRLTDIVVAIDQLLLDPNNPRYADLGVWKVIPETRVSEDSVQQQALARLQDPNFEVDQLQESIEKMGFLRVDRMVVVELPTPGTYKVIEGNRRLAAIKTLLNEAASGEVDLSSPVADSLDEMSVVLIEGGEAAEREEHARNLQGIRHIAGVKQWGAYQQAQAVGRMIEEGMSVPTIKSALGLSPQRVNLLRSVYLAMKQMREDPDFTEQAKPALFSHFVEALNRPQIRDWLHWNKEAGRIEDETARQQFYGLLVGMEDEEGQTREPKIVDAKDFRLMPPLIQDPAYFARFLADPDQSLQDASKSFSPPPEPLPDWRSILRRDLVTLTNNVPHTAISEASHEDIELLTELRDLCQKFLHDIELVQEG